MECPRCGLSGVKVTEQGPAKRKFKCEKCGWHAVVTKTAKES